MSLAFHKRRRDLVELRRSWELWTRTVRRASSRGRLPSTEAFAAQRIRLLNAISSARVSAPDLNNLLAEAELLTELWHDSNALRHTDRDFLHILFCQCESIGQKLVGKGKTRVAAGLLFTVAFLSVFVGSSLTGMELPVINSSIWIQRIVNSLPHLPSHYRWIPLVTLLIVTSAIYLNHARSA